MERRVPSAGFSMTELFPPPWMKRLCVCGNVHYAKGLCRTCWQRAKRRAGGMPERRPVMTQAERVAVMLPAALADEVRIEAKRRKLPVSVLLREVITAHFKR